MAEKKYYWLKLEDGFFRQKEIKKLRKLAGGDTFTIIYLKLLLKSLESNGVLYYEGIEQSFAEEIALDIDEDTDNVSITLSYLKNIGILQEKSSEEIEIMTYHEMIGSETAAARRMRKKRASEVQLIECNERNNVTNERNNVRNCYDNVRKRYTDIDIEKDIEKEKERENSTSGTAEDATLLESVKKQKPVKHKHGEYSNVLLTDEELDKLKSKFTDWEERIERLSGYIESKGVKYKSHYATILNWSKREQEQARSTASTYHKREYCVYEGEDPLDGLF